MPTDTPSSTTPHRPAQSAGWGEDRHLTLVIAIVAMLGAAAIVDAEPVGVAALDAAYRALFVGSLVLAAARANRWVWFISSGLTTALAGSPVTAGVGLASLAVAIGGQFGRRRPIVGALVGAGTGFAALGLTDLGVFGASSLFALVAAMPLWVSGLARCPGELRRRILVGGAVVGVAAIVATALGAAAALAARADVGTGVQAARTGLGQFQQGEDAPAARSLRRASGSFSDAERSASAWWALPSRAVPVIAQHAEALDRLSTDGADVTAIASGMADATQRGELVRGGAVNLDALEALEEDGRDVVGALKGVLGSADAVGSGWLVPPVTERIDSLTDEVRASLPGTRHAVEALEVAPTLLGRDSPRRYLVLIGNPAEARELGGFVGSFGILSARRGDLAFEQVATADVSGRLRGLDRLDDRSVEPPGDLPPTLLAAQPGRFGQNWTSWPDFSEVTRLSVDLWEQYADERVDGVAYVDPHTLAALLEFTGPVVLADGTELTSENVADFMLRGQYLRYTDQQQERKNLLGDAADGAFQRLLDEGFPSPGALVGKLAPLVEARRLLFETTGPDADAVLDRTGLSGQIGEGNQVLVTSANTRANKLDAYLRRDIAYDIDIDPVTGRLDATVTLDLTNVADREKLNTYVTGTGDARDGLGELVNRTDVALYAPWQLRRITLDGERTGVNNLPADSLRRFSTTVEVGGGETRTVRYRLRGEVKAGEPFQLRVTPTATAVADRVSVRITRGDAVTVMAPRTLDKTRIVTRR